MAAELAHNRQFDSGKAVAGAVGSRFACFVKIGRGSVAAVRMDFVDNCSFAAAAEERFAVDIALVVPAIKTGCRNWKVVLSAQSNQYRVVVGFVVVQAGAVALAEMVLQWRPMHRKDW